MGTNTKEYARAYYQTHKEQMQASVKKNRQKKKIEEARKLLDENGYFVILHKVFDDFLEKMYHRIEKEMDNKLIRMTVSLVLFIWLWTVCLYLGSHSC